jgi:hypothetical protein
MRLLKSKFKLFQVQIKGYWVGTAKFSKPHFARCITNSRNLAAEILKRSAHIYLIDIGSIIQIIFQLS